MVNYGLDKHPPKIHVLKTWSRVVLLEGHGTSRRQGSGGPLRSLITCPQKGLWDPDLFFFLLAPDMK